MSTATALLSPEQLTLKADLDAAKAVVEAASGAYRALKASCTHAYQPVRETAVCAVCGERGGWWCPASPSHLCEYSPTDHCNDFCIHCGEPEERK